MAEEKKDWLCNKCEVGVLDPDKKVRSANGLEFGVVCSECGSWNPTISFTSPVEPFMSSNSGPIPPGIKATNPTSYKFGESIEWKCEECGFSPLPTFGIFDHVGHCPECGHDNSHQQDLKLVAGGIPKVEFGPPNTGIASIDFSFCFIKEGKEVGKLYWIEAEHCLRFEGQLDESSRILMMAVRAKFEEWWKEKYGDKEKERDPDTEPDWTGSCETCGASPIVPATGMCGPCTFGEAETAGGNW